MRSTRYDRLVKIDSLRSVRHCRYTRYYGRKLYELRDGAEMHVGSSPGFFKRLIRALACLRQIFAPRARDDALFTLRQPLATAPNLPLPPAPLLRQPRAIARPLGNKTLANNHQGGSGLLFAGARLRGPSGCLIRERPYFNLRAANCDGAIKLKLVSCGRRMEDRQSA
jgi:hypothetical protein